LENTITTAPDESGLPAIIATLEQQLAALDAIGAHIGAAHLDAAIQQLRLDQARIAAG
jgi:NADPH-dependent ferric siderophore reductase